MITIIKKAEVYQPEYAGKKDVMILDGKIAAVAEEISMDLLGAADLVTEISGEGKVLIPGLIDSHTHLTGGGGEGGFKTRTPAARMTDFTTSGVTTAVGCLGTDGITRNMVDLLAKARGLEEEGMSTYIYTGSYRIPVVTLTGEVMKDLLLIDKVIGVGEIAVSDHRSSQPTPEDFQKLAADTRVGGMLAGKAGVLNIHLGDGKRMLDLILHTVEHTEIPITQFLPTHINRNPELFEEGIAYAKKGGYVDFTASADPDFWEEQDGEIRTSRGIKRMLAEGVSIDQISMSSDAQGSLPIFNEKHECIGLGVGTSKTLLEEIQHGVLKEDLPLETALRPLTANPAKMLKLSAKGHVKPGYDADLCLLNAKDLTLDVVICKGQVMVEGGKAVVHDTFIVK